MEMMSCKNLKRLRLTQRIFQGLESLESPWVFGRQAFLAGFIAFAFCSHSKASDNLLLETNPDLEPSHSSIKLLNPPDEGLVSATSLQLRLGVNSFRHLSLESHSNHFDYPENSQAPYFGVAVEVLPFEFYGSLGFRWEMGFSSRSSFVNESSGTKKTQSQVGLDIIPISGSLVYLANQVRALKGFVPSVSIGSDYIFYFQNGEKENLLARGAAWILRLSLGMRHSLNWISMEDSELMVDYSVSLSPISSQADLSGRTFTFSFGSKI